MHDLRLPLWCKRDVCCWDFTQHRMVLTFQDNLSVPSAKVRQSIRPGLLDPWRWDWLVVPQHWYGITILLCIKSQKIANLRLKNVFRNWCLSSPTLDTAVVSTVQSMFGSCQNGQVLLYPFQKLYSVGSTSTWFAYRNEIASLKFKFCVF